jgi:hypothetical protein
MSTRLPKMCVGRVPRFFKTLGSHRWRLARIGVCAIATALAVASCVIRVAWLYQRAGPTGVVSASLTVEHGSCAIEWLRGPQLPMGRLGSSWLVNRQIDLGFRPRVFLDRSFGRTRLEAPISVLLLGIPAGVVAAKVVRRIRAPRPPGICRCGYPLTGLGATTPRCPECGREIEPVTQ